MHTNPLICDTVDGICKVSNEPRIEKKEDHHLDKFIHVDYFTDPICSSCWGIEPQLQKLKLEYGDYLDFTYHMGGLLPSWETYKTEEINKPEDVAFHWYQASVFYEMPIESSIWLIDPLESSYPPSIAFKAAQIQDYNKSLVFLRRLKEMVFLEKKNITKWEHIEEACTHAELDLIQLKLDYENDANLLFKKDLELTKKNKIHGFPTFIFKSKNGQTITLSGFQPYSVFEKIIIDLCPNAEKKVYNASWQSLFKNFPLMATREYSLFTYQTQKQAEEELIGLDLQRKIISKRIGNSQIWSRI